MAWSLGCSSVGTDSDGGHLNHGPFAAAILFAGVGLCVAVALQLQLENGMEGLIIRSLCLLLAACGQGLRTQGTVVFASVHFKTG